MVDGSQNFTPTHLTKKMNMNSSLEDIHAFLFNLSKVFHQTGGLVANKNISLKLSDSDSPKSLVTNPANDSEKPNFDFSKNLFYSDIGRIFEDTVAWLEKNYGSHQVVKDALAQTQTLVRQPNVRWGRLDDTTNGYVSENALESNYLKLYRMLQLLLKVADDLLKEKKQPFVLENLFTQVKTNPVKAWYGESSSMSIQFYANKLKETALGEIFISAELNEKPITVFEVKQLCNTFTKNMLILLQAGSQNQSFSQQQRNFFSEQTKNLDEKQSDFYFVNEDETQNNPKTENDNSKINLLISYFADLISRIKNTAQLETLLSSIDDAFKENLRKKLIQRIFERIEQREQAA